MGCSRCKASPPPRGPRVGSVLDLLSRTEVASVTAAEAAPDLAQGDEYLDLMNLSQGVRRALGVGSPAGRVLPKKAVLRRRGTRS